MGTVSTGNRAGAGRVTSAPCRVQWLSPLVQMETGKLSDIQSLVTSHQATSGKVELGSGQSPMLL